MEATQNPIITAEDIAEIIAEFASVNPERFGRFDFTVAVPEGVIEFSMECDEDGANGWTFSFEVDGEQVAVGDVSDDVDEVDVEMV